MKLACPLLCAIGLLFVCSGASTLNAQALPPITVSRIGIRDGRFVEMPTGKPFIPLGVNYYRVGKVDGGKEVHATFCPGFYDRAYIEKMMANLGHRGFNTVRTFQTYYVGPSGILDLVEAREISPPYLANVVHFLRNAAKNGLHVVFTWDVWIPTSDWWSSVPLADESGFDLRAWQQEMGVNNFRFCREMVRTRANAIVALMDALRKQDPALLRVVMAWELENEVIFAADQAPFKERKGVLHFAGKEYALSSDIETQALMDAAIVQWADICADAIHRADAQSLASASVFSFAAVGRGGPGTVSRDKTNDNRIPARPLALLKSRLDYVDIHLYAWMKQAGDIADNLSRDLASAEWPSVQTEARKLGKPILVGETGVFANYLRKMPGGQIDHKLGEECLRKQLLELKKQGFTGILYWAYGNPDSKSDDENPALSLSPVYMDILGKTWKRSAAQSD